MEAPDTHIPVSRLVSEAGEGRTPLSFAALHGQLDAVRLLLSYGSTVDLGRVRSGTKVALQPVLFLYSRLDRFLLATQRDTNASPLVNASSGGHLDVVQALLAAGADVHRATVRPAFQSQM